MKNDISSAHKAAKGILKATDEQIERGLALHKRALVCDTFGFNPYPNTKNMVSILNKMIKDGSTASELTEKRLDLITTEVIDDPGQRRMLKEVLDLSGVTGIVQTVGSGKPGLGKLAIFYRWPPLSGIFGQGHREDYRWKYSKSAERGNRIMVKAQNWSRE